MKDEGGRMNKISLLILARGEDDDGQLSSRLFFFILHPSSFILYLPSFIL
jgi:hypothetical protein